jgi:hypothetical protein
MEESLYVMGRGESVEGAGSAGFACPQVLLLTTPARRPSILSFAFNARIL